MRIPDGDLVPARRRPYSGGYGSRRRRRRRPGRRTALVLVLLLLAAAAAWFLRRDDSPAPRAAACPTPTATPTVAPPVLPAPGAVRVVVLNGTPRVGLADTVAQQLTARGFVVVRKDNAPAARAGASLVTYAPGAQGAAVLLARNVAGAQLSDSGPAPAGTVQVVLGGGFRRLATPAEVTAAAAASQAAAVPGPTPAPCRA